MLPSRPAVGLKFGNLLVLSEYRRDWKRWLHCQCDCGNVKDVRASDVFIGRQQSCGCLRQKLKPLIEVKVGERFGRLTVISELERRKTRVSVERQFELQCDCGTKTKATLHNLRAGQVRSCGCLSSETTVINNIEKKTRHEFVEGNVFGSLTLKAEDHVLTARGAKRMWLCACVCGREVCYFPHEIIRRTVISCGCIHGPYKSGIPDEVRRAWKRVREYLADSLRRIGSPKAGRKMTSLLGYGISDLAAHRSSFFGKPCIDGRKCGGIVLGPSNSEMDHIKPRANAQTQEDVITFHQLDNLRWICTPCNRSKGKGL